MPRRRAFTLIELLVVIAIITALLALLMPTLGRAVYASQQAVCASNKRQVMAGLLTYASDNFNTYPNEKLSVSYFIQDHTPIIFTALRDRYQVPLETWSCGVAGPEIVPYDWNGWKWKMPMTAYWVMRGGGGPASVVNPPHHILSDRISRQDPSDIVVSDAINGNESNALTGYHSYQGRAEQGVAVRMDLSTRLASAQQMEQRCNMGWGWWWY